MKKGHIALIVIASILVFIFAGVITVLSSPISMFLVGIIAEGTVMSSAEIEIDSCRLCENEYGEDIIIVKYLLKNNGKTPTALLYEGDFCVYQNGVSLTEYTDELPRECNYDLNDQLKNIKGGVEYYAEIAYILEYPDKNVEVEVTDYGFFDGKKQKVFEIR